MTVDSGQLTVLGRGIAWCLNGGGLRATGTVGACGFGNLLERHWLPDGYQWHPSGALAQLFRQHQSTDLGTELHIVVHSCVPLCAVGEEMVKIPSPSNPQLNGCAPEFNRRNTPPAPPFSKAFNIRQSADPLHNHEISQRFLMNSRSFSDII